MSPMCKYLDLTAKECADRLREISSPVILIHTRPDGDCVGSAAALTVVFSELGKKAYIASSDKIPKRLEFILEQTNAELTDDFNNKTLITTDVASPTQLGGVKHLADRVSLMIDHHAVGERFADGYIKDKMSSSSEVLFDIIKVLIDEGHIKLTRPMAYALYAAMSSDTGCFCYSNASPRTYRCAAELMEAGIDCADINHRLFHSKTKEQIKAEGLIAKKLKTAFGGKVAYASVTKKEMLDECLEEEHFDTAIDVVRATFGAKIALFTRETEDGKFKCSIRSTGANIASIAQKFGGGGHIRAAGCSPEAKDIETAQEMLLSEFKNII